MDIKARVYLQSNQNECGLCAIAALASVYGFIQPIEFYRKKFFIGRDGLTLASLKEILKSIYFIPTVEKTGSLQVEDLKKKAPCILFLKHHYVMFEKIHKEMCYIIDPAIGKQKITLEELNHKFGGYVITVKKETGFKQYRTKESDFRYIKKMFQELAIVLSGVSLISIISNIITVIIPVLLQKIVDTLLYSSEMNAINHRIYLCLVLMLIVYIAIIEAQNRSLVYLQCRIMSKLSYGVSQHLLKIKYAFFDSKNSADILFRLNLLKNVEQTLSTMILSLIMGLSTVFVIFTYFCFYDTRIALILGITSIGIGLYVYVINEKLSKVNEKYILKSRKFEGTQTEIILNSFQIKSMGIEQYFSKKIDSDFTNYKKAYKRNQNVVMRFNANINTLEIFFPIVLIAAYVCTGMRIKSLGELLVIYILISFFVKHEAITINSLIQLARLKPSLFFINDILDEHEIELGGNETIEKFEKLEVKNLDFKYNDNQELILKDINLTVKRGQKVAIVGISGEGKTTLIKILCRLYDAIYGDIQINGKDISEIIHKSYFDIFNIVSQQAVIFNATIRENILLGLPDITDDRILNILQTVNFYDDVKNMPMGLDTVISNQNNNLSGGQIQKIAIARCLIRNPQILILDEATSSLDIQNEMEIHRNLKKLGITLLVISHRLSTIVDSDMIYYMRNGRIQESGTQEELMLAQRGYYSLYCKSIN